MQRQSSSRPRTSLDEAAQHSNDLSSSGLVDEVYALSSAAASASAVSSSPSADGLALFVKGKPLTSVVQLLADALVEQRARLGEAREANSALAQKYETFLREQWDAVHRLEADVELHSRPFLFTAGAFTTAAQQQSNSRVAGHSARAANSLADAVRRTHSDAMRLRSLVLRSTADTLCKAAESRLRERFFELWCRHATQKQRAAHLERSSVCSLLAVYFSRWRSHAKQGRRARQMISARHVRAVLHRSTNSVLKVYMTKWRDFVDGKAAAAGRLRAYQQRVATLWSVSGPAVTAFRRTCFLQWLEWAGVREAQRSKEATTAATAANDAEVITEEKSKVRLLQNTFAAWQEKAQQRRLHHLLHRLSRVLAAQNSLQLLRRHYKVWVRAATQSERLRRLEILAADQHNRRVTALARRYFNELRLYRREQQFQRMMRSVEDSLLTLADRLTGVERIAQLQGGQPLFVSPPRPLQRPSQTGEASTLSPSPVLDRELVARVEALLSQSQ